MQEEIKRKIDKILTMYMAGKNERKIDKNLTICANGANGESMLAEANFVHISEKSGNFISHSLLDNE